MSDFTYIIPFSNEKFLIGIRGELKRKGQTKLYNTLKNSRVSVDKLGTSYYVDRSGRWNAEGINIKFYVHQRILTLLIQIQQEQFICNMQ